MAQTGIDVKLQDTQIGVQTVNDGVSMLVSPGAPIAAAGGNPALDYDTPLLITSLDEAVGMGIDAAYDAANNAGVYFNIAEFYSDATKGKKLWICIHAAVDDDDAPLTTTAYLQTTKFTDAVRATKAGLFDNRPRLIGLLQGTNTVAPAAGNLSADVLTAIPLLQTAMDGLFTESIRAVVILDSGKMVYDDALPAGDQFAARAVALAITTTTPGKTASVGLLLGRYASIGLATSAGEVMAGPIATDGYLMDADGTSVKSLTKSDFDDLGAKQYLFLRERVQRAGVYLNDDATLNDPLKALSQIPRMRVGNSICDLCEWYFGGLINASVPVTNSGNLNGTWKSSVLNDLNSKYIAPRINRGDASNIVVDIAAVGNFVETQKIQVTVRILPTVNLAQAEVYVFYVSSITA